jgi:YcxB-like protein
MTIHFTLRESDLLEYQLFVASQSEIVNKRRMRTRILIPIMYISLAIFGFFTNRILISVPFLIGAVLWYVLYPIRDRKRHIKYYHQFIQEHFRERIGNKVELILTMESLETKEIGSESKYALSEVEQIVELKTTILIRLRGNKAFILPKDQITQPNELKATLQQIAEKANVIFDQFPEWEFK